MRKLIEALKGCPHLLVAEDWLGIFVWFRTEDQIQNTLTGLKARGFQLHIHVHNTGNPEAAAGELINQLREKHLQLPPSEQYLLEEV